MESVERQFIERVQEGIKQNSFKESGYSYLLFLSLAIDDSSLFDRTLRDLHSERRREEIIKGHGSQMLSAILEMEHTERGWEKVDTLVPYYLDSSLIRSEFCAMDQSNYEWYAPSELNIQYYQKYYEKYCTSDKDK